MSKGNELYVRKSRSSDPTMASDTEDQMWDDSSMTAAYDKAVNKANAEIAKQIAMETNSKFKDNAKPNDKKGKTSKNTKGKVWKQGMPCRAVFFEDGQEYEAVVYAILDETECVVRFLGYENSEIVNIDSLKESRGDEPRIRQIEQATGDKFDDGFESLSNEEISIGTWRRFPTMSVPSCSLRSLLPQSLTKAAAPSNQHKGKKAPKKKSQKPKIPQFGNMPNIPDLFTLNSALAGPAMPDFRLPNIPFPPPPPGALSSEVDPEEQALSSMLISWYMSGYHTGLYQGMKRSKENRRH